MGIESDKGLGLLEKIVRFTTMRHKILASNIANADTPGYRAKDIPFNEVMSKKMMELQSTNPAHLRGVPSEMGETVTEDRSPWEDGNNVALDMELANMTENGLLYQAGVKLMSAKFQIYKNAIK